MYAFIFIYIYIIIIFSNHIFFFVFFFVFLKGAIPKLSEKPQYLGQNKQQQQQQQQQHQKQDQLNHINARNKDNTQNKLNSSTGSSSSTYPDNFNTNHFEANKATASTSKNGNPTGLAAAATIKILSDTIKILSSNKTSTPGDLF